MWNRIRSKPQKYEPKPRGFFVRKAALGAVRLVLDEGKTVGAAARELDLTPSALAQWVRQAPADGMKGNTGLGLTTEERQRLKTLSPIELSNQVVKLRLIMFQESR